MPEPMEVMKNPISPIPKTLPGINPHKRHFLFSPLRQASQNKRVSYSVASVSSIGFAAYHPNISKPSPIYTSSQKNK